MWEKYELLRACRKCDRKENEIKKYNKQSPETSPIYPNQRIKMLIF